MTVKIRILFVVDLQWAVATGKLGLSLWMLLVAWSQLQPGDIQFLEGLNSKIKIASTRCPRMELSTLSERMRIQSHLACFSASASEQLAAGKGVVKKMEMGSRGRPEEPHLPERWTPPAATSAEHLPTEAARSAAVLAAEPWLRIGPERRWAMAFSLAFNKLTGKVANV